MRSIVSLITVLLISTASFAQTERISKSQYQQEVAKELSSIPNGADLYHRCDVFSRAIDHRIALRLGLESDVPASEGTLSQASDTTAVADVFKNSDQQDETTIAISRANPKLIVAAANDGSMWSLSMPAFVSSTGGASWKAVRLPVINDHGCVASGDPMLVSDDSGMFYYAYLVLTLTSSNSDPFISDIVVARSTNGTQWTLGAPIMGNSTMQHSLEDKETIAVDRDPASPHYGRIYVEWTHFYNRSGWAEIRMISHSDDHGKTWSKPTEIPTTYGYIALMRVGKGGTIFISSSHIDSLGDSYSHGMLVSHDGGATFVEHPIADYVDYPRTTWNLNALKGDDGPRAFPYAVFDVDPKTNTIYAVYGSWVNDSYAAQFGVTSTDEGQTWSDAMPIGTPDFLESDHFQPWVAFDPVAGKAFVSLYSSEEDFDNNIQSREVVTEFGQLDNISKLGNTLFDPLTVNSGGGPSFLGDYTGSDAYGGYYAATWTQNRVGARDGDVFAYITTGRPGSPVGSSSVQQINASAFDVHGPYPNPVSGSIATFDVTSNESLDATVELFDLTGRMVSRNMVSLNGETSTTVTVDIRKLPAGVYRAVLSSGTSSAEKNLVILR